MKRSVKITNVGESFAFGVTTDSYEQVYIPASIVKAFIIERDDDLDFILVPNKIDKSGSVPWFATYLLDGEDDEEETTAHEPEPKPAPKLDLKEEACRVINERPNGSIFTTSLVAELINQKHGTQHTSDNISAYLDALHSEGRVARAAVNQKKSDNAKYSLWAADHGAFKNAVKID